jgi:hypothetical protein
MNRFVLKNTFIKVYKYHFYIKIRGQSYALETVLLSKMTSFTNMEGVYHFFINIFYKNKRSKLCFGDRVAVLNDF